MQEKRRIPILGKEEEITIRPIDAGAYLVRPANEYDLAQFQGFQDGGLATDLDQNTLEGLVQAGLNYSQGAHGIVPFAAVDKKSEEVMGRAYLKTWHVAGWKKPIYELNDAGGYNVVSVSEMMDDPANILEIGGALVKPEHRKKGILKALTYARLCFLAEAEEELGKDLYDSLFIVNVGVLPAENNENKIDYADRLQSRLQEKGLIKEKRLEEVANLAGKGEVLNKQEIAEIFSDLEVYTFDHKSGAVVKRAYEFGTARKDTLAAQKIAMKLVYGGPLLEIAGKQIESPFLFSPKRCMHPEHGGQYTIRNKKERKNR